MQYRTLGRTGLKVSALSLGGSSLGGHFRDVDESEARTQADAVGPLDDHDIADGADVELVDGRVQILAGGHELSQGDVNLAREWLQAQDAALPVAS